MDAAKIDERLRLGEDSRTEFKGVARNNYDIHVEAIASAIAAFANSGGGHILLGIERDGTLTGVGTVEQADALMRKVGQACRDLVLPRMACDVTKVIVRGVPLLVVEVPGHTPGRPYFVHGRFVVREGSETREGTRAELLRIAQSVDYHFDEQPVDRATDAEIDVERVADFVAEVYGRTYEAVEATRYLRALGCLDESDTPTVAGVLFFGRDPQRWFADATVSAVRFPGTETTTEFLDRQELSGPLAGQLAGAASFLSKHLSSASRVEGWERKDLVRTPHPGAIPIEVQREAVLNALAHRDYRMASQTRLFIYDDRIEIINPGELLNRLTVDSIRFGISQRRNPRIAALLARAHTARREHLGLGVPEMFRLMRERRLPEPEFAVGGGHFRVVIRSGLTGAA